MDWAAFILFIVAAAIYLLDGIGPEANNNWRMRYPLTLIASALVAVGLALFVAELFQLFE